MKQMRRLVQRFQEKEKAENNMIKLNLNRVEFFNITDKKNAQQELKEMKSLYRSC